MSRQEMWATSGSWKRRGNGFSLELLEKKHSPADTLIVAQRNLLNYRRLPIRRYL